jgi:hypothetical protein
VVYNNGMNKPFKIKRNDYDNIYFGSDFHYNHQRDFLWEPRGFKSYQEHDRFIENEIGKLTKNDLLIYLGDYSLNTTDEQTSNLLHKTKARMFYIFGNHEGYHSRFYRESLHAYYKQLVNPHYVKSGLAEDHSTLAAANFTSEFQFQIFPFSVDKTTKVGFPGAARKLGLPDVRNDIVYFGEEGYFQIGNNFYFCRHMAPLIWDKMKYENYFSICGHSHGNLKTANHDTFNEGKILDVGVDNAIEYNGGAFFKIEEVDAIMKRKKIQIHDHHGDEHI